MAIEIRKTWENEWEVTTSKARVTVIVNHNYMELDDNNEMQQVTRERISISAMAGMTVVEVTELAKAIEIATMLANGELTIFGSE